MLVPRNSLFDFDNLWNGFFTPMLRHEGESAFFTPRIEMKEKDDQYLISAELPGVKKEDVHLTLQDGVLAIEAESKQEDKEEKDGKVIRQERRYGKFYRSFTVGQNVQESDITAHFEDGVLTLTAPKATPVAPEKRQISIS